MRVLVTGGSGFVGRELLKVLRAHGHVLRALVRTDEAAKLVAELGAQAVRGDLTSPAGLATVCEGVDVVVHLAAHVSDYGDPRLFYEINVEGTRAMLEAARRGGARRFVHISTEAVLLDGRPLCDVDETRPLPDKPIGSYAWSKGLAETLVCKASRPGFSTIVLRPRFVWGRSDTTLVPRLIEAMKGGSFAWVDGGVALTSTCHVQNLCAGIECALTRGEPGGVYFLTDGEPIAVRPFIEALVRPRGVTPSSRSVPRWLALAAARATEWTHDKLKRKGPPSLTRTSVLLLGQQMTVNDSRARRELGYRPVLSRDAGLAELFDTTTSVTALSAKEDQGDANVPSTRAEAPGKSAARFEATR